MCLLVLAAVCLFLSFCSWCVFLLCDLVLDVAFVLLFCSIRAACVMCCWVFVAVMVYAVLFYCGAFVLFSYVCDCVRCFC